MLQFVSISSIFKHKFPFHHQLKIIGFKVKGAREGSGNGEGGIEAPRVQNISVLIISTIESVLI